MERLPRPLPRPPPRPPAPPNTPLTDENFHDAISACLESNPTDGLCSDIEYGSMVFWDTSEITSMTSAFEYKSTFNADISYWNTEKVTSMSSMFSYASAFNQDIGSWNTAQVTDMSYMFSYASAFNQDISFWTGTAATTAQNNMLSGATAFQAKYICTDVTDGPVSSCTCNLDYCLSDVNFHDAIIQCLSEDPYEGECVAYGTATKKYGLMSNWDTKNVTNMKNAFLYSTRKPSRDPR